MNQSELDNSVLASVPLNEQQNEPKKKKLKKIKKKVKRKKKIDQEAPPQEQVEQAPYSEIKPQQDDQAKQIPEQSPPKKTILGFLKRNKNEANEQKEVQLQQMQEEADMANQILKSLGTKYMSESLIKKVIKYRLSPEAVRVISSLELGHLNVAKQIALDFNFIQHNKFFVQSGQAIRTAINRDCIELAQELIQAGYQCPFGLIVDAVNQDNDILIQKIIEGGFYDRDRAIMLEFWYLLYKHKLELAHLVFDTEEVVRSLLGSLQFPNEANVNNVLGNEFVAKECLKIALEFKQDFLAARIIGTNNEILCSDFIDQACQNSCLEFLLRIWSGVFDQIDIIKQRNKKHLDNLIENKINQLDKVMFQRKIRLSYILNYMFQHKKLLEA